MNELNLATKNTMTLKEITDLLDVRHNDAMKTVEKMALEPSFGCVAKIPYKLLRNNAEFTIQTYQLTLKQAAMVTSKLSTKLSAKFFESAFTSSDQLKSIITAVNLFDAPDLPDRYIYAAQDSQGRLKIGISKNPEERVKQLNVGHPDNLELVYTAKAIDNTYMSEQLAHEKCKDYHLRSEWFSAPALELLNQH